MNDLSKRFSRSEFACPCGCGQDAVDYELIINLESLADYFEQQEPNVSRVVVHINSGNRCKAYDYQLKIDLGHDMSKPSKSQHLFNKASDFWMEYVYSGKTQRKRIPDDLVADKLEEFYPNKHGIGRYKGRTHYDTRTGPARWDNR